MLNFTSTTNPGNGVIGGKQWTGRTLCALLYAVSLPGYAVSVREYYGIPYNRHDVRNTGRLPIYAGHSDRKNRYEYT